MVAHKQNVDMASMTPNDAVCKNILLKQFRPTESDFGKFKSALNDFKSNIDSGSRESFIERRVSKLLEVAFYGSTNYIDKPENSNIDLVLLDDTDPKSDVKVIIEAKRIKNTTEFPTKDGNINVKALHETILYYLRERITKGNKGVRSIIITNANEWFIFDAREFELDFALDKDIERMFLYCEKEKKTDDFYTYIQNTIDEADINLNYVHFAIDNLRKNNELLAVFKILSPYYLLGKPCATDSNILNDKFYKELLHIIGLYENDKDEKGKKKAKKTIERLPEGERESGSLLENTITQLSYDNPLNLFERGIQLVIIWINRILFLKLLEAQLLKWHNNDKNYKFLTFDNLSEYGGLKELFFGVLAKRPAARGSELERYKNIPYLNSSLFEKTEKEELDISALKNNVKIKVYKNTVLKGEGGKEMNPLEYLLRFLDAYDFGATESEDGRREDSRTLINASVLGLIFEKINGYKDGSFYTPGTITQYMCRETLRRAVVQKFNEKKTWHCGTFAELKEQVKSELLDKNLDRNNANEIINSLRICDPAVGSGHFLVSALNELIAIKAELRVLQQIDGSRLAYHVEVENDELIVRDEDGKLFVYKPDSKNPENQTVQESLSSEKQTIIENCLFGVDINPNSVNICRLRLWIELLKNAYYYTDCDGNYTLNTLPNIDINIKCRNSLVSRYDFDINVSQVLNKNELEDYKAKVRDYKATNDKSIKHELGKTIDKLKEKFKDSVQQSSKKYNDYLGYQKKLSKLNDPVLFPPTAAERKNIESEKKRLRKEIAKYEENQKNSIFENAMEWRFEFPEILDDNGNFIGFDVVIGNPPYISSNDQNDNNYLNKQREYIKSSKQFRTLNGKWDIYIPFIELGLEKLCAQNAYFSMIIPYPYTNQPFAKLSRKMLTDDYLLFGLADFCGIKIFPDAEVENCIPFVQKTATTRKTVIYKGGDDKKVHEKFSIPHSILIQDEKFNVWNLTEEKRDTSRHSKFHLLRDYCYISYGLRPNSDEKKAKSEFKKEELISEFEDKIHCKKYIEGKDLERYRIKEIHFLEWGTERCPAKIARKTFPELYEHPKLLINTFGEITATLDTGIGILHNNKIISAVPWKSLHGINNNSITKIVKQYSEMSRMDMENLSDTINLCYLLGIMNSRYANVLLTNNRGDDINIYPEYVRDIPIPSATIDQQQPIINLVNQILAAKKQNPQANTSALEHEIDLLVYHLYDLSFDEVKLIDENVTEEEFATAK